MKTLALLLVAAVSLAGCKEVVSIKEVGEPRQEVRSVDCRHSGFCFTCMPGFGGNNKNSSCSFKWSSMCPGKQPTTLLITPIEVTYDDGSTEIDERKVVLSTDGSCK